MKTLVQAEKCLWVILGVSVVSVIVLLDALAFQSYGCSTDLVLRAIGATQ